MHTALPGSKASERNQSLAFWGQGYRSITACPAALQEPRTPGSSLVCEMRKLLMRADLSDSAACSREGSQGDVIGGKGGGGGE